MAQESFEQLLNAVKQAESRGQRFDEKGNLLTSPKGAQGEMQVMPKTAKAPGYGVAPAQGSHPDELARVGKDYLQAMLSKYGDTKTALMAYNWGPKNTDDWLASGADPKKVPAETQKYTKDILNSLSGSKANAGGSAPPTDSEKMMTDALKSGMSAQNLIKDAGPGYKAAMAMMFLADDKPKSEEDDIWKEAEPEQTAESDTEVPESPLASLDLSYKSPFPAQKVQPVAHLAAGGLPGAPKVGVKGTAREELDKVKADYDRYAKEADTYNTALNTYKTDIYDPYTKEVDKYNTSLDEYKTKTYNPYVKAVEDYNASLDKYKQDLYTPYVSAVDKYNADLADYKTNTYDPYLTKVTDYNTALEKYNTDIYSPYSKALDEYNAAAEAWNAGPRTTAFDKTAPTLSKTFDMAAPTAPAAFAGAVPTAPEAFSGTAPTAPEAFSVTAPTLAKTFDQTAPTMPTVSQADYDKMVAASRQDVVNRQHALDVASNPEAYGLTINKLFARGGVVHRADGTPPEGEVSAAELEAASKPYTGNPNIKRQGEAARALAAQRDVNTLPDPKTYAAVSGFLGTPFEEQGWSVFHPKRKDIEQAADTGFIAGTATQIAPVFGAIRGAATQGTTAAKMLSGLKDVPVGMSIKPTEGIFTHLPSGEAPFVGRLDEYISALPGPVQKQQFFGQLKGKFRDYEIGRAEEALADLPANAKLTPSDLLNRVKGVYDPGQYKTTVMPPESQGTNNFYRSMDNPFYNKDTDEGVHLGVIHLNQSVPEEVAQRQKLANEAARAVKLMNNNYYIGRYPEQIDALDNFLKTSGINFEPELAKKLETGASQYRKISNYENEMKAAKDKLMYPVLDPEYDNLHAKYIAQFRQEDPSMPNYAARTKAEPFVVRDLAEQANAWLKQGGYKPVELPDFHQTGSAPGALVMTSDELSNAVKNAFEPVKEHIAVAENNLNKYMKGTEEQFKKAIGQDMPYMGQHTSLGGGPAPISFSRYSEHTTNIPGIGKTEGIYVHELQSDLLDDLRKQGPKGGSMRKDTQEYYDINEKLGALQKTRNQAYESGNSKLAEEMDNQIVAAEGRARVLSRRLNDPSVDYNLQEAFSKMETGGKTTQQLMAKNAVAGAIQQGKNFVAFPGKESAQAQLYEKLPRNLKDVVKDLGPGFEIRPVELEGPHGKSMHTAIVWGPEAAARIQKKGVPFATGGAVDKANIDHRKYM